jgi:hypothetical protein
MGNSIVSIKNELSKSAFSLPDHAKTNSSTQAHEFHFNPKMRDWKDLTWSQKGVRVLHDLGSVIPTAAEAAPLLKQFVGSVYSKLSGGPAQQAASSEALDTPERSSLKKPSASNAKRTKNAKADASSNEGMKAFAGTTASGKTSRSAVQQPLTQTGGWVSSVVPGMLGAFVGKAPGMFLGVMAGLMSEVSAYPVVRSESRSNEVGEAGTLDPARSVENDIDVNEAEVENTRRIGRRELALTDEQFTELAAVATRIQWVNLPNAALTLKSSTDVLAEVLGHHGMDETGIADIATGRNVQQTEILEEAALIYDRIKNPQRTEQSPFSLSQLVSSFRDALTKDFQKDQLFKASTTPGLVSNSLGIIGAIGKNFTALCEHPDIKKSMPGFYSAERADIVGQRLDEDGISRNFVFGTVDHAMATTVKQHTGYDYNESQKAQLQEKFNNICAKNPAIVGQFYITLATESGEKCPPDRTPVECLQFYADYAKERIGALDENKPTFDRHASALKILERKTGLSAHDLKHQKYSYTRPFTNGFGASSTEVRVSQYAQFKHIIDSLPANGGGGGQTMTVYPEDGVPITIDPSALLEEEQGKFNRDLVNHNWTKLKAKDNLRMKGVPLTNENIQAEIGKVAEKYRTQTEVEVRHDRYWSRLSSAPFVGKFFSFLNAAIRGDARGMLDSIPVVSNMINFGEGLFVNDDHVQVLESVPIPFVPEITAIADGAVNFDKDDGFKFANGLFSLFESGAVGGLIAAPKAYVPRGFRNKVARTDAVNKALNIKVSHFNIRGSDATDGIASMPFTVGDPFGVSQETAARPGMQALNPNLADYRLTAEPESLGPPQNGVRRAPGMPANEGIIEVGEHRYKGRMENGRWYLAPPVDQPGLPTIPLKKVRNKFQVHTRLGDILPDLGRRKHLDSDAIGRYSVGEGNFRDLPREQKRELRAFLRQPERPDPIEVGGKKYIKMQDNLFQVYQEPGSTDFRLRPADEFDRIAPGSNRPAIFVKFADGAWQRDFEPKSGLLGGGARVTDSNGQLLSQRFRAFDPQDFELPAGRLAPDDAVFNQSSDGIAIVDNVQYVEINSKKFMSFLDSNTGRRYVMKPNGKAGDTVASFPIIRRDGTWVPELKFGTHPSNRKNFVTNIRESGRPVVHFPPSARGDMNAYKYTAFLGSKDRPLTIFEYYANPGQEQVAYNKNLQSIAEHLFAKGSPFKEGEDFIFATKKEIDNYRKHLDANRKPGYQTFDSIMSNSDVRTAVHGMFRAVINRDDDVKAYLSGKSITPLKYPVVTPGDIPSNSNQVRNKDLIAININKRTHTGKWDPREYRHTTPDDAQMRQLIDRIYKAQNKLGRRAQDLDLCFVGSEFTQTQIDGWEQYAQSKGITVYFFNDMQKAGLDRTQQRAVLFANGDRYKNTIYIGHQSGVNEDAQILPRTTVFSLSENLGQGQVGISRVEARPQLDGVKTNPLGMANGAQNTGRFFSLRNSEFLTTEGILASVQIKLDLKSTNHRSLDTLWAKLSAQFKEESGKDISAMSEDAVVEGLFNMILSDAGKKLSDITRPADMDTYRHSISLIVRRKKTGNQDLSSAADSYFTGAMETALSRHDAVDPVSRHDAAIGAANSGIRPYQLGKNQIEARGTPEDDGGYLRWLFSR